MTDLRKWIVENPSEREWRPADLAHRGGTRDATVSRILHGSRKAGPEVCVAIVTALDVPPERVFRIAGILPPLPPAVEEEEEAQGLFRGLDAQMQDRAGPPAHAERRRAPEYGGTPRARAPGKPRASAADVFGAPGVGDRQDLETMPLEDQQRVFDLMRRLRGEKADSIPVGPET